MSTHQQHKAIETQYAGTLFRSRLEARWAVVFDHLGIRWEYEPEAFELDGGLGYLPDFWLPDTETWAEVKGSPEALKADNHKLTTACEGGSPLWGMSNSYGTTRGLLILGPIPRSDQPTDPWIVQHHKGVWVNSIRLESMTVDAYNSGFADIADSFSARVGLFSVDYPHWPVPSSWADLALAGCFFRTVRREQQGRWPAALAAGRSARSDPASRTTRYGL